MVSHSSLRKERFKVLVGIRYADDTTLMAESKELKSLLMKVKEESEKVGLKLKVLIKAMVFPLLLSHFSRVRLCASP